MAQINVRLKNGEVVPMTHPDDWTPEQVENAIHESFPDEESNQPAQKEESEAQEEPSSFKSVGADAMRMLGHALKGGIGYLTKIPGEIRGIKDEFKNHPLDETGHALGQIGVGITEDVKSLANLALLPFQDQLAQKLSGGKVGRIQIPEDTGLQKFLGLESNKKGDELLKDLPDIAAIGTGLVKGVAKGVRALKSPDLSKAIKETQAKVNGATKEAGQVFNTIESEVRKRGISKVSIDDDVINQAENYLSKTPANKALLEKARTGDYTALRKLQADLRVKGEKALSSSLKAENDLGEEMLANRDEINSFIQNHLEVTGHKDLAKALDKTRNDYREIMDTYFSSPSLAKVFGKSQKVPKNPMTLLTEDSTEMNKFMEAHPEVKTALTKAIKHKKKMKALGKVAGVVGIGTVGGGTYKILGGH